MTKAFWIDALERAGWSFLAGALVLLPADAASLLTVGTWRVMALAGALAMLSLLKSVALAKVGAKDSGGVLG